MADSFSPTQATSKGQILGPSPSTISNVNETKAQTTQPRVRRRNRIIASCLECRRRKLKCDKGQPCSNCVKVSRQCHFIAPGFDAMAQARLAEVKEKMGILERSLEEDLAQQNRLQIGFSSSRDVPHVPLRQDETYSEEDEEEDIKDLKPSDYVREDSAYYEDDYGDDEITDLGIAMGKVRITERIGGLVRPKFSDEVSRPRSHLSTTDHLLISFLKH